MGDNERSKKERKWKNKRKEENTRYRISKNARLFS